MDPVRIGPRRRALRFRSFVAEPRVCPYNPPNRARPREKGMGM